MRIAVPEIVCLGGETPDIVLVTLCHYMSHRLVGAEIPIDSDEGDEENKRKDGRTLLSIFKRGSSDR